MERYTEDALMSDMILCLRELDNREQPNTCRVLAKLATDYTKNMADAQATVEALQARVRELEESRDAWMASQECSEKAYMALVNQIPAERFDYDPVNVALLDGAKEQEIIGRKQIADLQAALDAEREKVKGLEHRVWELEGWLQVKPPHEITQMEVTIERMATQLTQLQELLRAFFSARAVGDVEAYTKVFVELKRTLDATTPTIEQEIEQIVEEAGNPVWPKGGDGE